MPTYLPDNTTAMLIIFDEELLAYKVKGAASVAAEEGPQLPHARYASIRKPAL